MNKAKICTVIRKLAIEAGKEIMEIYNDNDFKVKLKEDESPVTIADETADKLIFAGLREAFPNIPIVTEEQAETHNEQASTFFIVDPLDGTKEFINRNGQFTVNLALIENNIPSFGLVSTPIDQTLYWGGKQLGAWRLHDDSIEPLQTQAHQSPKRVVASKSHLNDATRNFITNLGPTTLVQAGSSLKLLRIAEGEADIYPRLAPTCEWDTAASQAVLEGAGGKVTQVDGSPMQYGKADILNPHFVASS